MTNSLSRGRVLPVLQYAKEQQIEAEEKKPDLEFLRAQFAAELELLRNETVIAAQKEAEEIAKKELQKNVTQLQQTFEQQLKVIQQQMEQQAELLNDAIQQLQAARQQLIDDSESGVLELSFACVSKILGEKYFEQKILAGVISEVLTQNKEAIVPIIRVSREDYEHLLSFDSLSNWVEHLQVDETLTLSSCIIDIGNKRLDVSLLQQMDVLRQTLISIYEQRQHARIGA